MSPWTPWRLSLSRGARRTLYRAFIVPVYASCCSPSRAPWPRVWMEWMTGTITAMEPDAPTVVVAVSQGKETLTVGGRRSPQAIGPKGKNTVP